jgi:hypothetical protein
MSEDDKRQALGYALIKFGAKAAKGKKGREIEALTEGAADAADEYVKTLNQAKKDKRQLTKDLAEYGLAKEKNRIAEQSARAQLAQSEAAMTRAERTGSQAERTALIKAWQDESKITPADKRLPFPVWLQTQGFGGAPTTGATPGMDIRSFYK